MNSLPSKWIDKIFMVLHGRFGNQFLDKFKTGQTNQNGQDCGIDNAKLVWANELAGMQPDALKSGLNAIYTYPPSCDEFKAQCMKRKEVIHPSHVPLLTSPEVPRDEAKAKEFLDAMKNLIKAKVINND